MVCTALGRALGARRKTGEAMQTRQLVYAVLTAVLCSAAPLFAAVRLVPTVTSGLSSPLFVGHAGDGSNRLFIVEQGGIIKVLQPGSSTPTPFLDIHTRVLVGGERGLVGLAFHPQYGSNGRFFVFYTRTGDGALVIAEYHVSPNPDVASATETVLLTIPHPTNSNHNGGMLAFGFDNYLYVGVGDGGSANDPPNNAQNTSVLLGKILRINVDQPDPIAGTPYSSPPDNPFVNRAGRDEIYAFGMRNPWRFSFDRLTGQQWVGDVGQGAREEVDTPIVKGGNYGWRVYEGFLCTNNDPALCTPSNYLSPVFDYQHVNGRCSMTGGYIYRGSQDVLSSGTYVYGDYCSGEIFTWNGAQTLLLDTAMRISSFGEDEQGELYVVDLNGSVSRIASDCSYSISPTSQSFAAAGGTGNVTVTAGGGCAWTAVSNASWIDVTSGASGTDNGIVQYSVDANASSSPRTGTLTIAGQTFTVSQSGAVACTVAMSPTSASFPQAGGSTSVTVTAPAGCGWTAVSNSSWIMVTAGAAGSGNGMVTYSVAPYTGRPKNRKGTVTIAGLTLSVRQTR
jgi:glucose/arabinose dehydrogenase